MRLASRGLRDMDDGEAPIDDAAELAAVRRQARRIKVHTLVVSTLLTALFVAFG